MKFDVQLESEANLGSGEELLYISYNSFADLQSSTEAGSTFSPVNIIGAFSTTGLAFDGSQYIVQLESEANLGSGEELLYISYDSFADLQSSTEAGSVFSPVNIIGAFSTTGLAFDGSQYIVQLESEANLGAGEELLYISYNSFADLVSGNEASSVFSPVNIIGAFSTTGLAFDGSQYIVQLESEANLGAGEELLYIAYNSFADLVSSTEAGSTFSPVNIIGDFSTTGLSYDGPKGDVAVPAPFTFTLILLGLAALGITSRPRR